jgi:hypothetical protein
MGEAGIFTTLGNQNLQIQNHTLTKGLDQFFAQLSTTVTLVNHLIGSKSYPQEILLLLCSRIDALASASTSAEERSGKAFTDFVTLYGGRRKLFESISLGDLYYELDFHLWLLPGMIEKAGRIRIFSHIDEPILKLLVGSEIALTLDEVRRFLTRIRRSLRRNFQVAPHQRQAKQPLASAAAIEGAVLDEFRKRPKEYKIALRSAISPFIRSKTIARILYHRFRCEVIHGGKVRIDEQRFFAETEPYWRPMYSECYGPFQLVEFPARFLEALFVGCIRNYRQRLEQTRKIPPDIHFEMFPDDLFAHLELLDQSLLPRGRIAVPK